MTSVFRKILSFLPLVLFILGLTMITTASFLINQIAGFFVAGFCLIILAILIGRMKGDD